MKGNAPLIAVFGSRGTGKSAFIKQYIARAQPRRLVVFDPMHEYGPLGVPVGSLRALYLVIKAAGARGPFALIYQPPTEQRIEDQFNAVCREVFAAGNVLFVAEELNKVTKPGWAPEHWKNITSRGRHRHVTLIGASQRPASVDKDYIGNATVIRSGRLNFEDDQKTVARALGVLYTDIRDLPDLAYIERDTNTREVSRGVLSFAPAPARAPRATRKK